MSKSNHVGIYHLLFQPDLEMLSTTLTEQSLAYWKQQLAGALPVLELATDRPRSALRNSAERSPFQTGQGARQSLELPKPLTEAIKEFSQQEGSPLFVTLLAALNILLYRYTGQEDILVGSPVGDRNGVNRDGLIGSFVNALVLRTKLSGNLSFRELQAQVHEVTLEASAHQDLPFETLLEELQAERNLNHHPLFQVMFVFQEASTLSLTLPNLTVNSPQVESPIAALDLTLVLKETSQGISGWFEYNADLFDAATITRMTGHFQTLLEGILGNPDTRVSDLPLLTAAERYQLLVEWNNTQADYPKQTCIHQLFEELVERTPDAVAVVFEDQQLTYRELNSRANQLAHYLQGLGVKPDVLVAISVERSIEMVVGFLGILKAGGAYVPLDPSYPHERRAYKLQDSQTPVILTQERLVASLPDHKASVICLDADWEVIAQQSSENPISETTVQNLAYVIYTSGSTGKPKGVMITHQGMVNHSVAIAKQFDLKNSDHVLQFSSMSFDIIIEELFPALLSGARVIFRTEEMLSSTASFLQFVEREQVSILNLPTAFWHELVNGMSLLKQPMPTSVRLVVVGGEKASRSAYSTWLQLVGEYPRWLNTYGPTETTVTATVYDPLAAPETDHARTDIPIGRPIANVQAYILDQQLQPVPIGMPGELYIGGAGLGRGYLNRPDLTADKFIPNPFSNEPNARLYKTGDKVRYLPDGNIEFIGRIDFQVKIRGFRIELGEIEAVLEQHPAVQQAVVIAREDVPGNKRLVAYFVAQPEQTFTSSELRQFVKQKLPDYMVPSTCVQMDTLPLTPNDKVDRRALPAPDLTRQESSEAFVAPRDELELQLTKIWEQVLGIQPIGIQDNIFELGVHSLLAARLANQIEQTFKKNLPLTTIFQAPTIKQLAHILRQEAWSAPCSSLVVIQPGAAKPPLFCIHVLGEGLSFYRPLARYLGREQPLYGLSAQILDEHQAPPNQIEELAAYYIKEMQALQPEGPYYLAGVSFGGQVAFEIARQLTAQGQAVGLVALLDSYSPGEPEGLSQLKQVSVHISNFFQSGPAYIVKKVKTKIEELTNRFQLISCKFYQWSGRPLPQTLRLLMILEENRQAGEKYVPQVYSGQVTLFRSTDDQKYFSRAYLESGYGWQDLAAGGVEIHDIPGDHLGILAEPNVQVLGEKLSKCLEQEQLTTWTGIFTQIDNC
ncbi:MAG: amino acid adenylation domain-containing protein [Symplocastrum torsivum CPER-KK1]|uniref:Amino acid adenylation domain-containing protein n=1 Tax=Symplocastrum torsivum CPER-KK1 TaxID=450513 RepID=A0A951PN19_9CYAN|nr:amino acid adenylation domain-containing protein [Symplocastrum torsivum CPER-KK1]